MIDTIVLPKKESRVIRLRNGKEVQVVRKGVDLKQIQEQPPYPTTEHPQTSQTDKVEIPNSEFTLPDHWIAAVEDYNNGKVRKRTRSTKKPKRNSNPDW
jgi:hypothetical protein